MGASAIARLAALTDRDQTGIEAQRAVEQQRIENARKIKEQQIQTERSVETAEIERRKTVEIAEQERAIVIAEKSRAQSDAQALEDKARALAVHAEEGVVTVAAEAEKKAAEDRALALKILAQAESEKVRIAAQGDAEAEKVRADAAERRLEVEVEVEAEGRRKLHEADNVLSPDQIAMHVRMALLKVLPDIIRESVKPLEQIEGIKIVQVEGLNGSGNGANAVAGSLDPSFVQPPGNLADQVVSSALRYRAQAPLLDSLLGEMGLTNPGDLNALTSVALREVKPERPNLGG